MDRFELALVRFLQRLLRLLIVTVEYVAERMGEPGTWQGVAFICSLLGSKYASLDWGQAAAVGASVSAFLKVVLPDIFKGDKNA